VCADLFTRFRAIDRIFSYLSETIVLTTISKCLAVFTVVASLLFLGIAVITTAAGPNWAGDVEELPEFTFTKTVAETGTTWGAKSRSDEGFSKTGIMPEVIVAARKKLKDDQDDRIKLLDQQIEAETLRLLSAKQLIAVDIDAIDRRIVQLTTDLADIKKQINEKTAAGTKLAEEISQLQATTETRREEVIRLQAKLDEVRADKFRADEQKKRLIDLLARVTGNIDRAERRNQQLRQSLNKPPKQPYDGEPTATGAK
jgi:regulator of replication initiation timing